MRFNKLVKPSLFYISFIIISLSSFKPIQSVIYLPFTTKEKLPLSDPFFGLYLSTQFEVGTPPQLISAEIDFQEMDFHLSYTRKYMPLSYNKSLSRTYINTTKYHISTDNFLSGCRANESFYFYINDKLNQKKEYKNVPFFMSTATNQKFCAVLGFEISWKGLRNFVVSLKYAKVINSYTWTLSFNDINNGLLIIGDEPHAYDNTFDENKLRYTKIYKENNLFSWCFEFNKILSGNNIINKNNILLGIIRPEIQGIVAPIEYYENIKNNFFEKYITNNICKESYIYEKNISITSFYNEQKIKYIKIECLSNKFGINDINNFPILNFINIPLNYSFILKGNDLLLKDDDKYIFQIYLSNVSYWYIGRVFLSKYQLVFNEDNKLIGFYTGKKEKNDDSYNNTFFKVCFIIIITFFCIFLFLMLYKRLTFLWFNKSKMTAKELEDDFSYKKSDIIDENNNNDGENALFEKND